MCPVSLLFLGGGGVGDTELFVREFIKNVVFRYVLLSRMSQCLLLLR